QPLHSRLLLLLKAPAPTAPDPLSLHDALPICSNRIKKLRAKILEWQNQFDQFLDRSVLLLPVFGKPADYHGELAKELLSNRFLRSEEHTSELQSRFDLVCRLLLEKKKDLLDSS